MCCVDSDEYRGVAEVETFSMSIRQAVGILGAISSALNGEIVCLGRECLLVRCRSGYPKRKGNLIGIYVVTVKKVSYFFPVVIRAFNHVKCLRST